MKSDVIFKEFWRNNERFADLFNVVVFGGREVIKPEILQDILMRSGKSMEIKNWEQNF